MKNLPTFVNETIEKIKARAQETAFHTNSKSASIKNAKLDKVFRETSRNYIFEEQDDNTKETVYVFIPKEEQDVIFLKGSMTNDLNIEQDAARKLHQGLNLEPQKLEELLNEICAKKGEAKDLLEKSNIFLTFQRDPKPLTNFEKTYGIKKSGLFQRGFTPEKPKPVAITDDELNDAYRTPSELRYVQRKREMDELFQRGDYGCS